MAVAKAPIILSECNFDVETGHNCKCMEILILALMDHEYECRCTKFQAADYGSVQSQERYILLVSKIGLPNVPGILSVRRLFCSPTSVGKGDSGIERELRVQGFKRGYNVCGSQQVRHIREAIPPPLAKAIASSINEHVNALIGGVEDVRTKDFEMGSRKRKAADEPRPERPSKRGLADE
jgi:site-specific DNA-cytosine methylase